MKRERVFTYDEFEMKDFTEGRTDRVTLSIGNCRYLVDSFPMGGKRIHHQLWRYWKRHDAYSLMSETNHMTNFADKEDSYYWICWAMKHYLNAVSAETV